MDTKSERCCSKIKNHSSSSSARTLQTRRNTSRKDEPRAERALGLPPRPMKSLSSAALDGRPRKRALLCGVSYKNWKHRLLGTLNDVRNMQDLLINHFGYSKHNIRILTEYETNPERVPTKKNIQSGLKWLVEGCRGGESLVFYFSGHGLRQPDFAMDELDGYDETICPVDFMEEGMISDNEINATIVSPLKAGVNLHSIVDACHSATMLDLAYVYDRNRDEWVDNRPPSGAWKATSGGLAICLSACGDDEFAADTSILSGKTMNGALTFILIDLVKRFGEMTYGRLLDCMQEAVRRANKKGCLPCVFFRKLFEYKQIQEPRLSSSEIFDVHKKIFTL
ncbi:Metacaspase-1, partial [Cucurbita argyrosperma subsp. sororia]